jgi:hypothetical protein
MEGNGNGSTDVLFWNLLEDLRKSTKELRIPGIRAEIRTRYLTNINYCWMVQQKFPVTKQSALLPTAAPLNRLSPQYLKQFKVEFLSYQYMPENCLIFPKNTCFNKGCCKVRLNAHTQLLNGL